MEDSILAIKNFFSEPTDPEVIRVGDRHGVEKFYKKVEKLYNLEELKAILDTDSNMLIVSGAGSGKTTALILKLLRDALSGRLYVTINKDKPDEYNKIRKILVSTFLKSGAEDIAEKFDKLCAEFKIEGITSADIKFRTIHSEVYSALKDMGITINIDNDAATGLIKRVCNDFKLRSKMNTGKYKKNMTNDEYNDISCIFSYARNRLDKSRFEHPLMEEYNLDDLTLQAMIQHFSLLKRSKGIQDFEDLEEQLYDGYQKFPKVLEYVKSRYDYIYVDEFQDTSQLQYAILKPYLESSKGFLCIGDDDQCLVKGSEIVTKDGIKYIEDIHSGDEVLSSIGEFNVDFKSVDIISSKRINTDIVEIQTKSGKIIRGTLDHKAFAYLKPEPTIFYVYLMYRKDIGFRIGQTSGVRTGIRGVYKNGIEIRCVQEKSDGIWILKEVDSLEDARYYEMLYSLQYGIPQYVFEDNTKKTDNLALSINSIKMLHNTLNTFEKGLIVLKDFYLDFETPHFIPKARDKRVTLNLSIFGGYEKNRVGVSKSELSVNTSNLEFKSIVEKYLTTSIRKMSNSKNIYFTARRTTNDIDSLLEIIKNIEKEAHEKNINVYTKKYIKIANKKFNIMPLGSLRRGMQIPIFENNTITEDEIVSVNFEKYDDFVYDMSVPTVRNFVSDSIFVSNCIYGWRGSDIKIITETLEKDFEIVTKQLTMNYRCTQNILNAVIPSIEQNSFRHPKKLKAAAPGGKVEVIVDGGVSQLIKSVKEDIERGEDVGILGRTNADLLIPAILLQLDGFSDFSISKSLNLDDRIPSQVLGVMTLILMRYSEEFEGYLKLFLNTFNSYQAVNLCQTLSTNVDYSLLTIPLDDLRYSAPDLFPILRTLRIKVKNNLVDGYLYLLEVMEEDVYNGKTIYAQRARDFTYYIREIIKNHPSLNEKTLGELNTLFTNLKRVLDTKKPKQNERKQIGKSEWITQKTIDNSKVKITTVHDAKGKEWDNVYIWNNVDGCFPNSVGNRVLTQDEKEEERRVHYIAWTRPRKKLTVFTRKDRATGFLSECDLSNSVITEINKGRNTTNNFIVSDTDKVNILDNLEKNKKPELALDVKQQLRNYYEKYTKSEWVMSEKGSNLDIAESKLGGFQGILNYLLTKKLNEYPLDMLEDTISILLEEKANEE